MRFPHFAFLLLASSALAQAPAAPDAIIARIEGEPVRMSDVLATAADTSALEAWVGFRPTTPIEAGVEHFARWYRGYFGV
jgi:nucleoside-diphosphate-sugar epimerase